MLILIQERKHFTNTNDIKVRITEEDEEKLYELNNILSKQIEENFRFYIRNNKYNRVWKY